ncbi:hypothetical protein HMPREF3170_09465 [Corynebacterium sp. HMSC08D02]|nr:hypothetical protein HMPREF3170_09465 [Corynebacterium sp. HMSC08D02]
MDWLVVGLGNPGTEYERTRHNVGYLVVDALAKSLPVIAGRDYSFAVKDGVAYARAHTYMNESGKAIAPLAARYNLPPERIVIVHDELDLPPGKVRLKQGGNENGHNGLKSLTQELGTRDYVRVRVGIGRPPKGSGIAIPDWVLAEFTTTPTDAIALAADAVHAITSTGLAQAQNEIHPRS